jgi:alanyl-tRNA synthetase
MRASPQPGSSAEADALFHEDDEGMTSRELRQSYLDFFAARDHRILPGSPLKPGDETTLFTTAGMQQFVPWFRGLVPAAYPRVVTCQKCFRADDIEQVGLTPWHCTFFEMLGNFSFGDTSGGCGATPQPYFKRGAIEYAWEYVTRVLQIPKASIWITVHPEDDESPGLWREIAAVPDDRIVQDPTNFWALGATGPCGPDTELHFDRGEGTGCGRPECNPTSAHSQERMRASCSCSRFTEMWNLVFQSYHRTEEGRLDPLPKPGIDTGMGFERVAAVLQGVTSIFETDLFAPIVSAVLDLARQGENREGLVRSKLLTNGDTSGGRAAKVIAEHTRALAFLLADGFTPSNEGAGYVVRRVIRRAYRFGRALGIDEPFLHRLVPSVVDTMGDVYPELRSTQARITTWLQQEENQFRETLERSYAPLISAIKRAQDAGETVLRGEDVFRLYDTYGLPRELAAEIAAENGLRLDDQGFSEAMEAQRQRGRARVEQDFASSLRSGYQSFVGKTAFAGYEACVAEGLVMGVVRDGPSAGSGSPPSGSQGTPRAEPRGGEIVGQLERGEEGEVFLDRTPFYAESGGQIGDTGELKGDTGVAEVLDTHYPVEGAHAHKVKVISGEIKVGQRVRAQVDCERRQAIARAHTATHLMHHVLRQVLGQHAVQSGSLVEPDRLRFDLAHFSALTADERQRIEEGVNALILQDDELETEDTTVEKARAAGATALFGEKYGERVRMVQIGDYSRELCGGTHLARSSAVGAFTIISEGSIGAGLRRVEAVTGAEARALAARQRDLLTAAAEALNGAPENVVERIEDLQAELRRAQREIARLQQKSASALAADLVSAAETVGGIRLLTARVELAPDALRNLADDLMTRLGSGIVVLGSESEGRVHFVTEVSKDLAAAGYHAGSLIREVAKVAGGGGGGRPDFAQAGGKNPERLDEALAKAKELVAGHQN